MPEQEDFLTNWGNRAVIQTQDVMFSRAASLAEEMKGRGYTSTEALDVLASDEFDVKTAEAAIQSIYSTRTATASTAVVEAEISKAQVVPTQYREVAAQVEERLHTLGSREFINRLARSKNPLMPVNDKALQSYYRLASSALTDNRAMNSLHGELQVWFEEAMYTGVCAAKSAKNGLRVAANNNGNYTVSNARGASCEVCLHSGTCTCSRFQESHFAEFGLACEHMIATADTVSPHERLLRALAAQTKPTEAFAETVTAGSAMLNSRAIVRQTSAPRE